eukprot:14032789-Alexandrium_andersonii.AAC.1
MRRSRLKAFTFAFVFDMVVLLPALAHRCPMPCIHEVPCANGMFSKFREHLLSVLVCAARGRRAGRSSRSGAALMTLLVAGAGAGAARAAGAG